MAQTETDHSEEQIGFVGNWFSLGQPLLSRPRSACRQFRANVYAGKHDSEIASKAFQFRTMFLCCCPHQRHAQVLVVESITMTYTKGELAIFLEVSLVEENSQLDHYIVK